MQYSPLLPHLLVFCVACEGTAAPGGAEQTRVAPSRLSRATRKVCGLLRKGVLTSRKRAFLITSDGFSLRWWLPGRPEWCVPDAGNLVGHATLWPDAQRCS